MQDLWISISPDKNKYNILGICKTTQIQKTHKNPLDSYFTFIGKTDLMTGLVNVLDLFARLHGSIWGSEFQSQGPSVL